MATSLLEGNAWCGTDPGSTGAELFYHPNQMDYSFPGDLLTRQQVILEKNTLDVFDNPNTDIILDLLTSNTADAPDLRFRSGNRIFAFVVPVEGLLRSVAASRWSQMRFGHLISERGQSVLNDLNAHGARLLTTAQIGLLADPQEHYVLKTKLI